MRVFFEERIDYLRLVIKELRKKFEYVSILGVDSYGFEVRLDKFVTNINDSNCERGFVIKVYDGCGYYEYATSDINSNNYKEVINECLENIITDKSISRVNVTGLIDTPLEKEFIRVDNTHKTIDEVCNRLKEYLNKALNNKEVINAYTIFTTYTVNKLFLTDSRQLYQSYPWNSSRVMIVTRRDDIIQNCYKMCDGLEMEKVLNDLDSLVDEAIEVAIALLDSTQITPGVYTVVTDPSITGLIAHEAFGHGVEMDMFVKNRAKAKEYIGKQVASPIVNMRDGANSTYSVGSYFFDDDGILAKDTLIIENGILKNGISDALSASILKTTPTGNGRREKYSHKAYTRMTNTFFEKGTSTLEEMIKSVDYGFYLVDTNNGMEDPKNWQIQCVACYAKEIKDGKFTGKYFAPVVISGFVLDLLKSISMVSNEFVINGGGYCGKGYKEWVPVSDGGPHLKAKVRLG